MSTDVVVIGAGLSGLTSGWRAVSKGLNTRVIATGWGATHWHSGCIDVLGYYPGSRDSVASPIQAISQLVEECPEHPYALVGVNALEGALGSFQDLCRDSAYPLHGRLDSNWMLPSAVGSFRPTCLAPETMIAGDLGRREPMLIVGFERFSDFSSMLVADNLASQGILARSITLELESLCQRREVNSVILARMFEEETFRNDVVQSLAACVGEVGRIGFPAVLGLKNPMVIKHELEEHLGCEVFEIPILPPSIPGMRLHQILVDVIEAKGGRVFDGMQVLSCDVEADRVIAVWSQAAARNRAHRAGNFILATGGILGGGISADIDGQVQEVVFDLPVAGPESRAQWFDREFLAGAGHPIHMSGIQVNPDCCAIDQNGAVIYENLQVVGESVAYFDGLRERSMEGVALVTGYVAGEKTGCGQ